MLTKLGLIGTEEIQCKKIKILSDLSAHHAFTTPLTTQNNDKAILFSKKVSRESLGQLGRPCSLTWTG